MKLTVWLPSEVLLEEEVVRIRAKTEDGWFGMLPKHVDFVTALVPSVLTFQASGKPGEYLAIDHGILIKCGPDVKISTRDAVRCASLEELKEPSKHSFSPEKKPSGRGPSPQLHGRNKSGCGDLTLVVILTGASSADSLGIGFRKQPPVMIVKDRG